MQVVYQCPSCAAGNINELSSRQRQATCGGCEWQHAVPDSDLSGERPNRCLICGNDDLWRQKDFPQGLGLAMVVIGGTASTVFYWYMQPVMALIVLMAFAALDGVLFVTMPDVLVCYRCRARHRKADMDQHHPRFDLELNERYRQEQIRLAEAGRRE